MTRLTMNNAQAEQPALAPDSAQVAYVSNQDGNNQIYLGGIDRRVPLNLTDHAADDQQPTWSPDGNWIAFTSTRRENRNNLYLLRAAGGEAEVAGGGHHPPAGPAGPHDQAEAQAAPDEVWRAAAEIRGGEEVHGEERWVGAARGRGRGPDALHRAGCGAGRPGRRVTRWPASRRVPPGRRRPAPMP